METSKSFFVRAAGPLACFTRPEMKVERVSYEVMTPGAARGLLEAILWKPAIRWQIHAIHVLRPIRWISFRRNEVNSRASQRMQHLFADDPDQRAQRNTVALRDVDYVIEARFRMTARAGREDSVRKFTAMFERRLGKGQWFHHPYLGCREFAAAVEPAPATFAAIDPGVERPLGLMLYDFDYPDNRKGSVEPLFFQARLDGGVMRVPRREELSSNEVPA